MKTLKQGIGIYTQYFDKFLLFAFIIMLPLMLLQTFFVNYIYAVTTVDDIMILGDFANAFMSLLVLTIIQVPYIKFVLLEDEGEERLVRKSFHTFLDNAFIYFMFSAIFTLMVVLGSTLFLIPGIVLLVFFYFVPYVWTKSGFGWKKGFSRAASLAKKHFFAILLILVLIGVFDTVLSMSITMLAINFTDSYFGVLIAKLIIASVVYPIGIIILTLKFNGWYKDMFTAH
ncbi:hypothetical protein [Sutcliffiella rhizosphaerae]|uniref:Beta-carotene 15,15'-monooxygenase n=1 Tax=Sutcliffiella rhizosphaerae TaxID=2880967 RepID=A0ABN8A593_9BACI|nr:hypothetical protein [Sutcliffiella rhizosphaerae]CAG9620266.1 hypothetical protein BACCIP111883_01034 [Sutcliffiella rhizosphaerae]